MSGYFNGYLDVDTDFSYPFLKYLWISNDTRIRIHGYRLVSKTVPNGVFIRGTRINYIHCYPYN
jgi:hypothetical protein